MIKALYISLVLFAGTSATLMAQGNTFNSDSLEQKMAMYGAKNSSPALFVHFDKTVYANNEDVWFTAYLLKAVDVAAYNTLSVALVNDLDRTVAFEGRYAMDKGIALGKAVVPDAAAPGNYTLLAITNRLKNKQPEVIFKLPVTIRSANEPEFIATLSAVDTSVMLSQQKVRVNVTFKNLPVPTKKGLPAPELQINYFVGNASRPATKGFGKTKGGVYDLSIPSAILTEGNNKLFAQLWYNNKVTVLSINLPARKLPPAIAFHPEGGNLVNNIQSRIGWQAKTAAGAPLGLTAFLYKNNTIVDTITTDIHGAGIFDIKPLSGVAYTVKIYGYPDATYTLPQRLDKGPVLSLENALINDTLAVTIKSLQNQRVYLIGHNYNEVFFNTPISLQPGYKRLTFVLGEVPAGLSQLVLVDSAGRKLAEKLFFSHYNKRSVINIAADKPTYKTREKVTVKIKLHSTEEEPAQVSIAGVQANRLPANAFNNIENYFYWKNQLPDASLQTNYLPQSKAAKDQLEAQLLVNTWGEHKWNDVISITTADAMPEYTETTFTGRVTYLGKPLTKPVRLFNTGNPTKLITTDNSGKFTLIMDDLKTDSAAALNFMVSDKDAKDYSIYLNDPYTNAIQQLAADLEQHSFNDVQGNTRYLYLPDNERAIKLKEVNIKAKKDDSFYGTLGNAAMQGQDSYSVSGTNKNADGSSTNYTQVFITRAQKQKYILLVNGIRQNVPPFRTDDLPPAEPQYISTLFWKHQAELSAGKATELTFNTSDITGRFKIIVQGKTASGVVYGETSFDVTK